LFFLQPDYEPIHDLRYGLMARGIIVALEHEYALIDGPNRSRVGRAIGVLSATLSSGFVYLLLGQVDVAKTLGWSQNLLPILLSSLCAGVTFSAVYWLFERHAWKLPWLSPLLGVPNLNGTWKCDGQTLNPDKSPSFTWQARVKIVQSWDRVRVLLKTAQSGSSSQAAAIIHDRAGGPRLLYSYINDPLADQPELAIHRGFAELVFADDLQSAQGSYFNGHGRQTFGIMRLTKEQQ
jgi:hypothetical protein